MTRIGCVALVAGLLGCGAADPSKAEPAPTDPSPPTTATATVPPATTPGTDDDSGTVPTTSDTGTIPGPRPVLCPPADLELCHNGVDDDGDGKTDCAIEGLGAPVPFATFSTSALGMGNPSHVLAPGDLTGDGVADLAVFENGLDGISRVAAVALPLPAGQSAPASEATITADVYSADRPLIGDHDGDGSPDVVLGLRVSDMLLYCDQELPWADVLVPFAPGASVDAFTSAVSTIVKPGALALSSHAIYVWPAGDVDGDGLDEHSVTVNDCATTTHYLVRGSSLRGEQAVDAAASWRMPTTAVYQPSRTHDIGDIDGDGVDDLAWTTYPISVVAGAQTSTLSIWTTLPPEGPVDPATADYILHAPGYIRSVDAGSDLSLDGAPDLVIAVDYGAAPGIYVVDGPPLHPVMDLATEAWSSYAIPAVGSQALAARAGDLNGDGYADLVIGVNFDAIYVDYAPCVGPHALPADGFLATYAAGFVLVDADVDGHLDIAWPDARVGVFDVVRGGPR